MDEAFPDDFTQWPEEAQRAWITSLRSSDINELIKAALGIQGSYESPQFSKDERAAILIELLSK